MGLTRALWAALGAAVAIGIVAAPASALGGPRPAGDHTLTTTHFLITYHTDFLNGAPAKDYSTETDAGNIAGYAEQAYALYRSWGFPAPPNDGDGLVDVHVTDLSGPPAYSSSITPDFPFPSPDTGYIEIATPTELQGYADNAGLTLAQEEQMEISRDVFLMFAWATWLPLTPDNNWTEEGAAQWAGWAASGYPNVGGSVAPPDIAVSCRDSLVAHHMCDPDPYTDSGYSRWAFFQMLANEYGSSFVNGAFVNGAAGQPATTALANAIAAKGSSLASQFNAYAANLMTGGFHVAGLAAVRPQADANVVTGLINATLPAIKVTPTNHLAARYVTFQRGDADASHACYAATLAINVSMPAGTSSQPYFFWDVPGGSAQALSVSGTNASISVPWDTCDWGNARGWLSIPNASTTVDGANFTVTSTLTVDPNTIATSSSAPPPASVWGTTVTVPTTDVAPTIDVFGPELLQLSTTDPTIRLIVDSSGPGSLTANLGGTVLGTGTLRAGNNDLRFVVPKDMLTAIRRSASAANVLTLTPLSPAGTAGAAVTRQVVITAPAKTTAKAKAKAKKHKKK
jgi:hypothetical protein